MSHILCDFFKPTRLAYWAGWAFVDFCWAGLAFADFCFAGWGVVVALRLVSFVVFVVGLPVGVVDFVARLPVVFVVAADFFVAVVVFSFSQLSQVYVN